MKILLILAKSSILKSQLPRSALFQVKTRVILKYFVTDCSNPVFFVANQIIKPLVKFLKRGLFLAKK